MNTIKNIFSGVLRILCAFIASMLGPLFFITEKYSQPQRTLMLSRQQRRYSARKRANDYTRSLVHLPRRWRRRYARLLAKSLFHQSAGTSITLPA
jgi:hypothetical protein